MDRRWAQELRLRLWSLTARHRCSEQAPGIIEVEVPEVRAKGVSDVSKTTPELIGGWRQDLASPAISRR